MLALSLLFIERLPVLAVAGVVVGSSCPGGWPDASERARRGIVREVAVGIRLFRLACGPLPGEYGLPIESVAESEQKNPALRSYRGPKRRDRGFRYL